MADQTQTPEAGFNYIKQAAQTQASNTQSALEIHKLMDQQSETYADAILNQKAAGEAGQAQLAAKNSIDASVDAQVAAMQKTLGTDWTDNASASSKWARELKDNTDKAYAALDVVHEQQSKTLFNDPIGHIMSQFTLPADVATYNYYAQKAQVAEGALNEVISSSNSAAVAANNMKQLTSTELAIANSKAAAAASNLQVNKLVLESAGARIAGIEKLQQLSQQQLATVFQVHSAQNDDRRLAMAQEQQAFMREARAQAATEKSQKDDDVRLMMESYNLGAKRTGAAQIGDVSIFRRMLGAINSNPDMAATLVAGQMIQSKGGNTAGVPVAQTSGEAALLYSGGQSNLKGNVAGTFLRDRLQEVRSSPGAPNNKAELAAAVTAKANARAAADVGLIKDDVPNIYDAPPLPALVQAAAGVYAKDLFFSQQLAPMLAADKNVTLNNTQILTKAAEMAKGGTGDFNAAIAGVVNYYKAAVVVNAATKQYSENGLPEQKNGFRASIWGKTLDLTNPADVKRAIMLQNLGGRSASPFTLN